MGFSTNAVQHSQTKELSSTTIEQLYWSRWGLSALLNETTAVAELRETYNFPTELDSINLKYLLTFQLSLLYLTYLFLSF